MCGQFSLNDLRALGGVKPSKWGWQHIKVGAGGVLVFFVQYGSQAFAWVLNVADPAVWEAIDAWRAEGKVLFAMESANGMSSLCSMDFEMSPGISKLRASAARHAELREAFLAGIGFCGANGGLPKMLADALPGAPDRSRIYACMVRTKYTGHVGVLVHDTNAANFGSIQGAVDASLKMRTAGTSL